VLVGDLTDRGPDSLGVLRATIDLTESGRGLCVRGNHDDKLGRLLDYVYNRGLTWTTTPLSLGYGIETTVAEFQRLEQDDAAEARALAARAIRYLRSLPYHLVLDGGHLVVSHAGIPAHLIGKEGPHLRRYALFGDPTGTVDSRDFPVRRDLAETYRGAALNVHGHIPIPPPATIRNNVCNVDTAAAFGGALTALLYPERTFVSIPAARAYYAH
jgi:protein phosphatase